MSNTNAAGAFRFSNLGPPMATVDGELLHLGGPVPRRVVMVLAASEGLWASDRELAEAVWGDHGPEWDERMPALRTTVARLNGILPRSAGRKRIAREREGYRLVVDAGELDVLMFEQRCEAADQALAAGQSEPAEQLAREALTLWRGRPFGELADVAFAVRRAEALVERWRGVQRVLVEALLATDRADRAVAVARDLLDTEADNVRWVRLLALALHRSGRNDSAVEACQAHARSRIDRGLLPATELADLEGALLGNDPALDWDPPGGDGGRPAGPKTFLFIGIADAAGGSGRPPVVSGTGAYEAAVNHAVTMHRGFTFDRDGPGFCIVFERPERAVLAACDVAVDLRGSGTTAGLRVTMAVHTGTAERQGWLYAGPHVSHVALLRNAGHPGQVLVSDATRGLVSDDLPPGVRLRDVGAWQLDGSGRADRVYQLVHDDLPADFPPLRAGSLKAGRLPRARTSFVGRAPQLAEVAESLEQGSLVTITGEGGIGKTRLAIEVGARALPSSFPHGVRYCDVSLADDDTLDDHIAASLGLVVSPGGDYRQEIVDSLGASQLLLVLDGCEHLHDAAASLVAGILAADPVARLLVTSRVRLDVPGEQVVNLETLDLPGPTDPDPGTAAAVELLVDRARAVDADVSPADPHVAELARRLDGLPLAIELAAIRLASIPASTLVARLGESFEAFSGPPDLPDRLRTLRATFEWSFEMVDPAGRRLLAALSVFRGTWSLEAAEAVAAAVDVDAGRVMALIAELVDLSIVRVHMPVTGTARYRMLDTIRTYAADHLDELGRVEAVADLHADYFLALAERAVPHRRGPDEPTWVGELAAEFDNLRAAHRHLIAHGRSVDALRLVAALGDELLMRERLEIGRWAAALAAQPAVAGQPLLVVVLGLAANAAMLEGRLEDALSLANRALEAEQTIDGAPRPWMAHNVLAMAPLANGFGRERWGRHIHAMEDISDEIGDPFPRALALWNRSFVAELTGVVDKAEAAARDLLALGERHDNPSMRSMGLQARGRVAAMRHDAGEAREFFMQALGAAEAALNTLMVNTTARELADRASDLGDRRAALAALCRIARSFIASGNIREQAPTALRIIDHLVALGVLLPAARALVCLQRSPLGRTAACEGLLARARAGLCADDWDAALHDGAALQLDRVLVHLVQVVDDLPEPDDPDEPDDPKDPGGGS